jgi:hypothetical protein
MAVCDGVRSEAKILLLPLIAVDWTGASEVMTEWLTPGFIRMEHVRHATAKPFTKWLCQPTDPFHAHH